MRPTGFRPAKHVEQQNIERLKMSIRLTSTIWAILVASALSMPVSADVTRASDWVGRVVLTEGGELLGRVEDFALNESMAVQFVVVSVGGVGDGRIVWLNGFELQRAWELQYDDVLTVCWSWFVMCHLSVCWVWG